MTSRQQEDLLHVLRKLDHLVSHLADISTDASRTEPYNSAADAGASKLYCDACDLLHNGQELLQQFDPALKFTEEATYHPSTAWMPEMPLRCCPECRDTGDFTGMVFEA